MKSSGESFIGVQYPRSNIADTHIVTDSVRTREKRALRRRLKSNPSRRHTCRCLRKKRIIGLGACPTAHFPWVSATERRIKASLVPLSYPDLLSRRVISRRGILKIVCMVHKDYVFRWFYTFVYVLTLNETLFCFMYTHKIFKIFYFPRKVFSWAERVCRLHIFFMAIKLIPPRA